MNFTDYRDEAYRIAKEHGFHEQEHSDDHLKCLVISELMEAVEADRKDRRTNQSLLPHFKDPDKYFSSEKGFNYYFEMYVKDTVEDELADACIRLFDLAGVRSIDIYFAGQIATEISPKKRFTENVLTITRFISGGTEGDTDDLMIRINYGLSMIFTLARDLEIDIQKHIGLKMAYNSSRPHKHGKGY